MEVSNLKMRLKTDTMTSIGIGNPVVFKKQTLMKYMQLPIPSDKVQCTYVWSAGNADRICGKSRTLDYIPISPKDVPIWTFCSFPNFPESSPTDSDLYLHPVALYKDPFRGGNNKLVFCETYDYKKKPTEYNKRTSCVAVMQKVENEEPWFGIEQEYTLLNKKKLLLGYEKEEFCAPKDLYCCGIGADRVFGRDILEAHYRACIYAGIRIAGTNVELMPSQFEFQLGPSNGIDICDDLWMARYILQRVVEDFGVLVTFDPKPISGRWLGCGAHTNFSTQAMRERGGIREIQRAIEKLSVKHKQHLEGYDPNGGRDNARRMTGIDGAPNFHYFTSAVADRNASVRIPRKVDIDGMGYLEDRRPAANCDPYSVCELIVRTVCLDE